SHPNFGLESSGTRGDLRALKEELLFLEKISDPSLCSCSINGRILHEDCRCTLVLLIRVLRTWYPLSTQYKMLRQYDPVVQHPASTLPTQPPRIRPPHAAAGTI